MFSYLGLFNSGRNERSSGEEGKEEEEVKKEAEEDPAPVFPALNSIQRSNNAPTLNIQSPDSDEDDNPDLHDDDLPDINLDNLPPPLSTLKKPTKPRKKVVLMPGFSQLDWAKLTSSGANLRGNEVTSIGRITRSELSKHKTKEDAWSSFGGKVYNITPYLNYHPGGVRELMRVAGKDGTELFIKTHAWISFESMLDSCLIGFLVND